MNHNHPTVMPTGQNLPYRSNKKQTDRIRLEIDTSKLRQLLNSGALCAADFRCLDCRSKQCIWQLCLTDCIQPKQT